LYIRSFLEEVPPLNTFEWQIISLINGKRTIKRICEKIGDELSTKTALSALFSKGLIMDTHPEPGWNHLVPLHTPQDEVFSDRQFPPLLRTNLLLNAIDGKSSINDLRLKLNMIESEITEDIKLLHDSHWIKFHPDQERVFLRLKKE
jgi:hypothetical protein